MSYKTGTTDVQPVRCGRLSDKPPEVARQHPTRHRVARASICFRVWKAILSVVVLAGITAACGEGSDETQSDVDAGFDFDSGPSIDDVRLEGRFDWCWDLQGIWDRHVIALEDYRNASAEFASAVDELDQAEASIALASASDELQSAENGAISILREAAVIADDPVDDSPRSIAYSRAWGAFFESENAGSAFDAAASAVEEILSQAPDHLSNPELLDNAALGAAAAARVLAQTQITRAVQDGSYESSDPEAEIDAVDAAYRAFVQALEAISMEDLADADEWTRDIETFIEVGGSDLPIRESHHPDPVLSSELYQISNTIKARRNAYQLATNLGIVRRSQHVELIQNVVDANFHNTNLYEAVRQFNMGSWAHDIDIYDWAAHDWIGVSIERGELNDGWSSEVAPIAAAIQVWISTVQDGAAYTAELEPAVFAALIGDGGAYDAFRKSFQESCRVV